MKMKTVSKENLGVGIIKVYENENWKQYVS